MRFPRLSTKQLKFSTFEYYRTSRIFYIVHQHLSCGARMTQFIYIYILDIFAGSSVHSQTKIEKEKQPNRFEFDDWWMKSINKNSSCLLENPALEMCWTTQTTNIHTYICICYSLPCTDTQCLLIHQKSCVKWIRTPNQYRKSFGLLFKNYGWTKKKYIERDRETGRERIKNCLIIVVCGIFNIPSPLWVWNVDHEYTYGLIPTFTCAYCHCKFQRK